MLLINASILGGSLRFHKAVICLNSIRHYSRDETVEKKTDVRTGEAKKDVAKKKLNQLLETMVKSNVIHSKARLELAKPRKLSGSKLEDGTKSVTIQRVENKVVAALKNVAASVGGNAKHTESELLSKLLNCSTPEHSSETLASLSDIVKGMIIDRTEKPETTSRTQQIRQMLGTVEQNPTIQRNTKSPRQRRKDIHSQTSQNAPSVPIDLFGAEPLGIFTRDGETSISTNPEVSKKQNTWDMLNAREFRLAVTHPPRNYFQQMIQWTNQSKLWLFPIDNEQGMDEEHAVYFNEHVFLEQYLDSWCPPRGPIRQFMELVCVGMSKNPYMRARTKQEHINWYRDYFAEKQQLLEEVGAITPMSHSVENIAETSADGSIK